VGFWQTVLGTCFQHLFSALVSGTTTHTSDSVPAVEHSNLSMNLVWRYESDKTSPYQKWAVEKLFENTKQGNSDETIRHLGERSASTGTLKESHQKAIPCSRTQPSSFIHDLRKFRFRNTSSTNDSRLILLRKYNTV
jgi:hypothetical protein